MTEHDLKQIVLDWQQPLYGLALRMLGNEADATDCTQDIFVKVFGSLPQYDAARPFKPWIYAVAQNVILDRLRRRTRHRRLNAEYEQRKEQMAAERRDDPDRQERDAILRKQLEGLDDETRLAVVLHYYDGMSQREVAEYLNLPQSTLNKRLADALTRMRQGLQTAGFAMLIPNIEPIMRNAGPVPVPPALGGSLLQIATDMGATAAVAATELTLGGIVMTKKILAAAAALLCVVSSSLGYTLALSTADNEPLIEASAPLPTANRTASEPGAAAVQNPDDETLAALRAENAALAAELIELRERMDAQAGVADPASADPEQKLLDSLDWRNLARMVEIMKGFHEAVAEGDEEAMKAYAETQQREIESLGTLAGMDVMKLFTYYRMSPDYPNLSAHPQALARFTELLAGETLSDDDRALVLRAGESVARATEEILGQTSLTALEKKARIAQVNLDEYKSLAEELLLRGRSVAGLGDLFMVADSLWNQPQFHANDLGPEAACAEKLMSLYGFEESQRANVEAAARDYIYRIDIINGGRTDSGSPAQAQAGMRLTLSLGSLGVTTRERLADYCLGKQAAIDSLKAAAAAQRAMMVFANNAQRARIVGDTSFGSILFVKEIEYLEGTDEVEMWSK